MIYTLYNTFTLLLLLDIYLVPTNSGMISETHVNLVHLEKGCSKSNFGKYIANIFKDCKLHIWNHSS